MYFRYSPAVVVVNMALHVANSEVAASVIPMLKKWYHGVRESVSSLVKKVNKTDV